MIPCNLPPEAKNPPLRRDLLRYYAWSATGIEVFSYLSQLLSSQYRLGMSILVHWGLPLAESDYRTTEAASIHGRTHDTRKIRLYRRANRRPDIAGVDLVWSGIRLFIPSSTGSMVYKRQHHSSLVDAVGKGAFTLDTGYGL